MYFLKRLEIKVKFYVSLGWWQFFYNYCLSHVFFRTQTVKITSDHVLVLPV